MIKWLVTVVVALFLLSGLMPLLRKLGIGRLPGDLSFVVRGRRIDLPIASTVLLSLLAAGVAKLI
ncbi:MAG: DUF2905 domain-containing protein [Lautropia sp.]